MRPFDLSSVLPEFAAEHASDKSAEAELGELFAQLSVVGASDAAASELEPGRARLLATVQGAQRFTPLFDKLSQFLDLGVGAVRTLLERAESASEWLPGPLPWVSLFHFEGGPALAGLDTGFVKIKRGMPFPRHRHSGKERVLILAGSYRDHEQRNYGPGDVHDMTPGTEHALQMSADEDVLLAVILSGEIELVGAP
ncbi:MAG TPA: cupin domain-containing protein [Polyangiaceae bacterium]|nr:cupin domain-containing protein [Polyangiaceae bacterium]